MKNADKVISILLCMLLVLQTACGNTGGEQDVTDNRNSSESNPTGGLGESEPGEEAQPAQDIIRLLHSEPRTEAGTFTKTWEKDYTSAEWEDGICLNLYVHDRLTEDEIGIIEDELNHRLHLGGYDFYVHFEQPLSEEYWDTQARDMAMTPDEVVWQRRQSGRAIDMYITDDYQTAVEQGILLDMTDYLQSGEGSDLYESFDASVWQQMESRDGRIYGIPENPVAATRYVYAYSPQLTDMLGIDMADFNGDVTMFEAEFPKMLEQGIAPITLSYAGDILMLQLFGLENYGGIFAIRHTEDAWEAVDLFEEEEAISFYEQLGDWNEKGFLFFSSYRISHLDAEELAETDITYRYEYKFLELCEVTAISRFCGMNSIADGPIETAYYVPQGQAFITENRNRAIYVVNADTVYPQECMQFLKLLTTDEEIRTLLYCGIENYHYIWQDDVLVFDSYGGLPEFGLDYDLRFWPTGHWGEKYAAEIEDLNEDVIDGISLTVDCDFAGLEEQYEACRQLIEENRWLFRGFYCAETGERLQALHEQLNEAGYQELIAAVNAMHG